MWADLLVTTTQSSTQEAQHVISVYRSRSHMCTSETWCSSSINISYIVGSAEWRSLMEAVGRRRGGSLQTEAVGWCLWSVLFRLHLFVFTCSFCLPTRGNQSASLRLSPRFSCLQRKSIEGCAAVKCRTFSEVLSLWSFNVFVSFFIPCCRAFVESLLWFFLSGEV